MKLTNLIATVFLLLLAPSLLAQSGTKDGVFETSNIDDLIIGVDPGVEVKITGIDTDKISYAYEFDGNSEAYKEYFQKFDPAIGNEGGYYRVNFRFSNSDKNNKDFDIKKNLLTIKIPSDIMLAVESLYSNIHVSSMGKDVEVYNRSGTVRVEKVGQSAQVNNEYGDIRVRNISGDVRLKGRSSRIDVVDITGGVSIASNYSKVNMSKVNGEVDITNKSGVVNVFEIKGNVKGDADYTEFELTNIDGDVNLNSKSGTISVDGALSLHVSGGYTNVHAQNIHGEYGVSIEGRSSNVRISNVREKVAVYGDYLKVEISNIEDDVTIRNRSGSTKVKNVTGTFTQESEYSNISLSEFYGDKIEINSRSGDISISAENKLNTVLINSDYGSVNLDMAKSFSGVVWLENSYGNIETGLKLQNTETVQRNNHTTMSGRVGDGNGEIRITVNNANISLQ